MQQIFCHLTRVVVIAYYSLLEMLYNLLIGKPSQVHIEIIININVLYNAHI